MRRIGAKKIDSVKIDGVFRNHVDREKALIMGLFPVIAIDKIVCVGNAVGDGARIALLNREKRKEANQISRKLENIELTAEEDFQKKFMEAMEIPHTRDQFPHLEGLVPPEILHQESY